MQNSYFFKKNLPRDASLQLRYLTEFINHAIKNKGNIVGAKFEEIGGDLGITLHHAL